jgi:NAD(P)-dependent dehydrogenase (short-subunit alcohol dehydrogenase family)
MGRMSERVALVTGGSSGIGERTAVRLHEAGFEVYAVARRVERMQDLAEAGVRVFAMDVTDDRSMTSGVERVLSEAGRIDVLVNNAGYGSYGAVEDVPIEEARRQFEVNVFGLARLTQLVTPGMRERAREPLAQRARIVNISSIGGKFYEPMGAWYHATKFAVEGFSDSLRLELAPHGIDVVIIEPGPIRTEWGEISRQGLAESSRGGPYEHQAELVGRMLARADSRLMGGTADHVARKVVSAVLSNTPRARYPVGRGAGTIVRGRRLLPDAAFDYLVKSAYRVPGRSQWHRPEA